MVVNAFRLKLEDCTLSSYSLSFNVVRRGEKMSGPDCISFPLAFLIQKRGQLSLLSYICKIRDSALTWKIFLNFLMCRWDRDFVGCVGAPHPSPGTDHRATQGFLYGRGWGPFRHAQRCPSLAPPQHPVQSHHRVRQRWRSFSTGSKSVCASSNS